MTTMIATIAVRLADTEARQRLAHALPVDHTATPSARDIIELIADRGVVVSVTPPGRAVMTAGLRTQRRILGLLGEAVVIVEAGGRFAALLTARTAHMHGHPVYALPGPVTSAASAGNHALIRDGIATLVTSAHDIRHELDLRACE